MQRFMSVSLSLSLSLSLSVCVCVCDVCVCVCECDVWQVQGALMLKIFISDFEQIDGQSCGCFFSINLFKIY